MVGDITVALTAPMRLGMDMGIGRSVSTAIMGMAEAAVATNKESSGYEGYQSL